MTAQPAGPAHGPDTGSHEVSLRVIYEEKAIGQAQGSSLMIPPVSAQCWNAVGRLAGDPARPSRSRTGRRTCGGCGRPAPGDV